MLMCRNTPGNRGTPLSTRSGSSMQDDEMLENELESIFSAGKVAMKSIFKEEDEQDQRKPGVIGEVVGSEQVML